MRERKFNIGDKVIRINKEFYNNSYHNGLTNKNDNMFIRSSIVSDVYSYGSGHWKGDVFYIDKYKHQVDSIGDSCNYQAGEICEKDGIATDPYRSHKEVWYHVEKDADKMQGKVIRLASREDVDLPVEEHLIVELYSK